MPLVEFKNVSKTFESGIQALQNIHLKIDESEFVGILGPSGCGKSSLLRLIAGLDEVSTGQVIRDSIGETYPIHQRPQIPDGTGFVFQDAQLLPWKNVFENIALPLRLLNKFDESRALEALELVRLTDFKGAFPQTLSGGMKMRVSLARALVTRPKLLLLDEPFAALDELTRWRLDSELRRIWAEIKTTIVFVTHSLSEALFLSNRLIRLSDRPGKIVEDRILPFTSLRDAQFRASSEFNRELFDLQTQMGVTR